MASKWGEALIWHAEQGCKDKTELVYLLIAWQRYPFALCLQPLKPREEVQQPAELPLSPHATCVALDSGTVKDAECLPGK